MIPSIDEDVKQLEFMYVWIHTWRECNGTTTLENSWSLSYKIKHVFIQPNNPALCCLLLREVKIYTHRKSTWKFIAALFIIVKKIVNIPMPAIDKILWINNELLKNCSNVNQSQRHGEWKKEWDTKENLLCSFIYLKF